MLEIRIDGKLVDYKDNLSLTFTIENPMFSEDGSIPVPFTTSIELPKTVRNLRVFGHPDRVNIQPNPFKSFYCEIIHSGIMLAKGKFSLEDVNESIVGSFVGSEVLSSTKKMYATLDIQKKHLGVGPKNSTSSMAVDVNNKPIPEDSALASCYRTLDNYLYDIRNQEEKDDVLSPFAFGTIRDMGREYDPNNELDFSNQRIMFLNPYLDRQTEVGEMTWLMRGGALGSMMPAIRVGYLLDTIFNNTLDNNIFNKGDYRKVVLQLLHHPTLEEGAIGFPHMSVDPEPVSGSLYNRYYNFRAFFPNMAQIDIVKEILKMFCLTLVAEAGRFKLVYNKDVIDNDNYADINSYKSRVISVSREKGRFYKYGYAGVEKETPEVCPEVSTPYNLWRWLGSGTENVYYSKATNQYISISSKDSTTDKWDYEVIDGGWGGVELDEEWDGEVWDMESALKPLDNTWCNIWISAKATQEFPGVSGNSADYYKAYYVPHTNGYLDNNTYPSIMLWHGYRTMHSALSAYSTYPFLSGKNKDADGNTLSSLTLEFDTADGLYNRFHKSFANWIRKDKVTIQLEALLPLTFFSDFKIYSKIGYSGKRFFIRELNFEISKDCIEPTTMELVED